MSDYSPHWPATIFASIALHFLAALGFSFLLEYFEPEPKLADVAQLEWVEVDLPAEVAPVEEEAIPSTQENFSTFRAQDLFLPEIKIPEPPIVEPPPEIKPIEPPKPPPIEKEPEQKIQIEEPPKEVVAPEKQKLGRPPVALNEIYPEKGSGLGYRGFVSVAVIIGKDGKVKSAQVVQSSGRMFVDEIARKAAEQWTFRPALDEKSKPMVSTKIITFDFKKFSEA